MKKMKNEQLIKIDGHNLFDRVVSILEEARANVVRSVNRNMVIAYWLIGREIVEEIQSGEQRAEYGKQVIEELSKCLTEKYGKGFAPPTLWNFRQFYQAYPDRLRYILSPAGRESINIANCPDYVTETILSPYGREFTSSQKSHPTGDGSEDKKATCRVANLGNKAILHTACGELQSTFSPNLSWSHYRALILRKRSRRMWMV
jgi:hypothetical protein